MLGAQEDAFDVDRKYPVELGLIDLQHRPVTVGGTGVVDDDVQPTELLQCAAQQRAHAFIVGHVDLDKVRIAAAFGNLIDHSLTAHGVHVRNDDLGALAGKRLGDALAKTRTGAGDDRDFIG